MHGIHSYITDKKESEKTSEVTNLSEIYPDDQTLTDDVRADLENWPTMDEDISESTHKPPSNADSIGANETLTSKSSESASTQAPIPLPRKKKTDVCKS